MKEDQHTGICDVDFPSGKRKRAEGTNLDGRNHSGRSRSAPSVSKQGPRKAAGGASSSSAAPAESSEEEDSDDDDDECPNPAKHEVGYCELECPNCKEHYNLAKRKPMQLRPCKHQVCKRCLPEYTKKGTCPMCERDLDKSEPSCADGEVVAELRRRLDERSSMLTATASTVLQLAAVEAQPAALSAAPPPATSADRPSGGATLTRASAGVQELRQRDVAVLRWAKERGRSGVPWAQHWERPWMAAELARRDAKDEAEETDDSFSELRDEDDEPSVMSEAIRPNQTQSHSFSGLRDEDDDDAGGGAAAEAEDDAMGD